jgi:PqqD family protein of HPr-rel-A system
MPRSRAVSDGRAPDHLTIPIYRTDFATHCRTHAIDGVTLAYHRPSGSTHFLVTPVPELLALIAEAPADAATLADGLCARLGIAADAEALAVVETRLAELLAAGLVRII